MKRVYSLWVFALTPVLSSQVPSGEEILRRIDANMSAESLYVKATMVVHGRRGTRTFESETWTQGREKSFTQYLSPPREKGTKMLKLGDRLWLYSPSADRIIQISGHLLRQSVMGSDLSYEDLMENERLVEDYQAVVIGEEKIADRICWVLDLTAKREVAYPTRRIWVDRERDIPLKEERYAKSGSLLKRVECHDIVRIDGRWYPRRYVFKDMLKEGKGTEFHMTSIQFDLEIPPSLFTKAALKP